MQLPCKACGYESPDTDHFCRQCGGQLSAENRFSSAPTINHGIGHGIAEPNRPGVSVGTGRLPPSVGDVIANETERFHRPPAYAPVPGYFAQPPNYVPQPSGASTWFKSFTSIIKGIFFFLLIAGLVGASGAAVFFSQEARRANERRNQYESRGLARNNANNRAQEAWEQMEEAIRLSGEAEEKAMDAGATLSISSEKPVDLNKYAYPEAKVESTSNRSGNEALSLLTNESFDTVRTHYERQFGKPVLQLVDRSWQHRKKLLFQPPTSPPILIKIEEEERQVKITILHSPLRFPRTETAQ